MRIPRACIQSTEPVARRPAGSQLRDTLATRHRRKGEDLKQQGASGIYLDPENSFFHNKRKGKGRKRKAPTPGPAAHIRSPWRTGVLPLLWAEGRPGGPAPVAGSSRPPCTPPGRQTARAGCAAAAPLTAPSWALSTRSHPRASTSVGTGDRWARSEAVCVTGGLTERTSSPPPSDRTGRGVEGPPANPVRPGAAPPDPAAFQSCSCSSSRSSSPCRRQGCFSPHHSPILGPSPADNSLGCLSPSLLSPPRRGVSPGP